LTRYAFGWTIIPVALFLFFFSGQRRVLHTLAALGAFVIVFDPMGDPQITQSAARCLARRVLHSLKEPVCFHDSNWNGRCIPI